MKTLTQFVYEQELSKKQQEYQDFFKKKLKKFGANSPAELSDSDKKKFFNEIDKEWTGISEKKIEDDFSSEDDEDVKLLNDKKTKSDKKQTKEEDSEEYK